MTISTWPSQDWKSLNFKNLDQEYSKVCLDSRENLSTLKSCSRHVEKYWSRSHMVLTVETPMLTDTPFMTFFGLPNLSLPTMNVLTGNKCTLPRLYQSTSLIISLLSVFTFPWLADFIENWPMIEYHYKWCGLMQTLLVRPYLIKISKI